MSPGSQPGELPAMTPDPHPPRPDPGPGDPILEEVRRNRAALVEAAGGTLDSLCAHLVARERAARTARGGADDDHPAAPPPGDGD